MQQGPEPGPYRSRLRADSNFYLELQFCNEHGLPHSEFLDWHEEDQAKALAFLIEKSARCVMCGTAGWEWDPEQGGSRFAYEAIEQHCPGCYAKAVVSREMTSSDGSSVILLPTVGREAAKRHLNAKRAWKKGSR